jgi:hypothetical protein
MPFPPELASRVDAVRAKLLGGDPSTELGALKVKLEKRDGRGGFKANVTELKAKIAEMEA